ncbi:PspC domain-containing protein [Solimonas soli]|uniref:PspC domain-containing protein n=1 Tax=Solimonas soli TaxID=413479 RepID=UPI0004851A6F|nr:PspC domain-containing protein [Solimonas soli]
MSSTSRAPRDDNGTLSAMRRYPGEGWIAGVCAGVADYFGWSVKVVRVLVILALIFSGFFPVGVIYLALWYLMDPADAPAPYRGTGAGGGPRTPPAGGRPGGLSPGDAKARFEKLDRRLRQIEACVTQDELDLRRQFKDLEA